MFQNVNLPVYLALLAIVLIIYYALMPADVPQMALMKLSKEKQPEVQLYDLGMYDFEDPNAFGVVSGPERLENASVRPEFNRNPFPIAEGCTDCARKGVPDPSEGQVHVSKCGFPSKRMIDAYGGSHFSLPHMAAPCGGELEEPSQLGRWWKKRGCSSPESVGLDLRPQCSRCGN